MLLSRFRLIALAFLLSAATCAHATMATTSPTIAEARTITASATLNSPSSAQTPIRWAYYVPEQSSLASLQQRAG
ncbi:MAG TPA: hypothetical protein VHS28_02705, partial [Chloroflexota bacterium]|nr:hypothetical protein [Chloroflexota bacterium]